MYQNTLSMHQLIIHDHINQISKWHQYSQRGVDEMLSVCNFFFLSAYLRRRELRMIVGQCQQVKSLVLKEIRFYRSRDKRKWNWRQTGVLLASSLFKKKACMREKRGDWLFRNWHEPPVHQVGHPSSTAHQRIKNTSRIAGCPVRTRTFSTIVESECQSLNQRHQLKVNSIHEWFRQWVCCWASFWCQCGPVFLSTGSRDIRTFEISNPIHGRILDWRNIIIIIKRLRRAQNFSRGILEVIGKEGRGTIVDTVKALSISKWVLMRRGIFKKVVNEVLCSWRRVKTMRLRWRRRRTIRSVIIKWFRFLTLRATGFLPIWSTWCATMLDPGVRTWAFIIVFKPTESLMSITDIGGVKWRFTPDVCAPSLTSQLFNPNRLDYHSMIKLFSILEHFLKIFIKIL